jgi:hypothetical protein
VTADLKKDLLKVRYDPAQVTPQQMMQTTEKLKFPAKVVQEDARGGSP